MRRLKSNIQDKKLRSVKIKWLKTLQYVMYESVFNYEVIMQ